MIRFWCECGRQLQAADADVGRQAVCPACGRPARVPGQGDYAGAGQFSAGEQARWQLPQENRPRRGRLLLASVLGGVGVAAVVVAVLFVTGVLPWGRHAPKKWYSQFTVAQLTAELEDEDSDIRYSAATDLATYGEAAAPAVEALTKLLDDPHPGTRAAAADALGKIGPKAESAAAALARAQKEDAKESVRDAAAEALRRLGPDAARRAGLTPPG